jgi:hypothetical protein
MNDLGGLVGGNRYVERRALGSEAARRYRTRPKQGAKSEVGLVCHHEFEEFEERSSLFLVNQAAAFAKMSRRLLSCRFSRRPPGEIPAVGAHEPFLPR